ncbi:MAG: ABC-F family ATP-binding cassette domain-containing protein [Myxococcales bacterium]|nr:ABC-F family ATP-binding cassette domain-containing protein [Polyangiaceae bacterium]MDW8251630.1 ABC-F family ATP-binding cassette domain-containing protein [Myxococcales bacterium]
MNIGLQNLAKSFGARTLFERVSLQLHAGARYGLVGANGAGKTTLLKIIAGDEPATEGSVTMPAQARVGVLRQDRFLDDKQRILDVVMQGDPVVWSALEEQARLTASAAPNPQRLADLENLIAAHDGYTLEARTSAILRGLGIPEPYTAPLGTLSGGFKLRVLLAQVLLGGVDVLLLDEPTNHLDILSIRWLETFLESYTGCALIISHDRRFLDQISTHILDIDYGTVTLYTGNYTAFEAEKAATRARKEAEIARAEKIIAEKKAFVERFGAKATKARQAQSRLKQIEKIEVEELAPTTRRAPRFIFEPLRPSGRDVLEVEKIEKSFGTKQVLRGVSLSVRRGERIAIIGANGLGKSTFLNIAVGRMKPDAGRVTWGHETHVGFFAQNHHELLPDPEATPLDTIWNLVPTEPTSYVRGQLGRALFSGDDVTKKVGSLSGGEAARLIFCRLMVERPNVLVLDEPTNHLDIESIEALVSALQAFEGTLLFVSHNRWFVRALATRILEVTPTGFQDFPGTYDEYLERSGDDYLDADAVVLRARRAARESTTPQTTSAIEREEQKRRRNRQKQLPLLRDAVIAQIEAAEARRKAIEESYCEPGFFDRTSATDLAALKAEDEELQRQIASWLEEWEQLEAEIAQGETS